MKSRRWHAALALGILSGLVACAVTYTRALERIDYSLAEIYASYMGKTQGSPEIILIPLENNRLNQGLLLRALSPRPPKVIAMMYDFSQSDIQTAMFDIRLAESMENAKHLIIPGQIAPVSAFHSTKPDPFATIIQVQGTLNHLKKIEVTQWPRAQFAQSALVRPGFLPGEDDLRTDLIYNTQNRATPSIHLQALMSYDRVNESQISVQTGKRITWKTEQGQRNIPTDAQGGLIFKNYPANHVFKSIAYPAILKEFNKMVDGYGETPVLDSIREKIVIIFEPKGVSRENALKLATAISTILTETYMTEEGGIKIYLINLILCICLSGALVYFHQDIHAIIWISGLFALSIGFFLFRAGIFFPLGGILTGIVSVYLSSLILRKEIQSGNIDKLF